MQSRPDSLAASDFVRSKPQLASLASNLTHQRWTEEALLQSEERYRIVTETAIVPITPG